MRKFKESKLLIATNNKGKVIEISDLLNNFAIEIVAATNFNLMEPEENGNSFIENAEIKSRYYSKLTCLPALADDSGLEVDALNGLPGIYSARWAGLNKDFNSAMSRIAEEIKDSKNLSARFICALSLCWPDGEVINVEGKVEGRLNFPPCGSNGFGYDPIFIPNGYEKTFAQMPKKLKESLSHRTDAFNKLKKLVF